jgi:bilirubin oxidase
MNVQNDLGRGLPVCGTGLRAIRIFGLSGLLLPALAFTQVLQPLAIPPLLDMDTFDLVVDDHVHQFFPGVNTTTYGVNGDLLGPTLVLHSGTMAHIRLRNELPIWTNMHWHGLHISGEADGAPPRQVDPGETWAVDFPVMNKAATFWYHPHPHMMTMDHVNKGLAGFIIVRDDEEAAFQLPRTYGVDDFPIVVQDRNFLPSGDFASGPYGDTVLVNGTPNAFAEMPAQVVRLRLLNGSNARIFRFGFDDGHAFHVIGSDGGLLNAPVEVDRMTVSNGERYEVLLDLSGMEGDSLLLMSYGSELTPTMPGAFNPTWEPSSLNGMDFPVLRIRVTAPTTEPVITIPTTFAHVVVPDMADVSRTRWKSFSGFGTPGSGMFMINDLMFDMDVINDTVLLGATERWVVENATDMAHVFHIHGGSFYVLERNGQPPPEWERGAKDVIMTDMADHVEFIMEFNDFVSDGWPYMYHCHNLVHEDGMMMLQYIVVDPSTHTAPVSDDGEMVVFPSPFSLSFTYQTDFAVDEVLLNDMLGRTVLRQPMNGQTRSVIDALSLPAGPYVLRLLGDDRSVQRVVVRE